jgi:hypothetical protein
MANQELVIEKTQDGKYQKWTCTVPLENLYEALYAFETNNQRGLHFKKTDSGEYQVSGWQGLAEKCYDTGRSVNYNGNALAVLDDDNHFIFKNMRICEKTANVYLLPVYRPILEITLPDPELMAKLTTDPVLFDCDTFQRDSAAVAEQIEYSQETAEVSIIYAGPFRCLFLKNGTIIRRGIPVAISKKSLELVGVDHCISLKMSAPLAQNYMDYYQKYGSIFLLDSSMTASTNYFPPIAKTASVSDNLKERLKNMIDNQNDYLILQGSDPGEKDSCCPNPLVPELKQMIGWGLMSSWAPPGATHEAGSCPMTVYAFTGEFNIKGDSFPAFTKNEFLRLAIRKYL